MDPVARDSLTLALSGVLDKTRTNMGIMMELIIVPATLLGLPQRAGGFVDNALLCSCLHQICHM
jgi:hypothetical protein